MFVCFFKGVALRAKFTKTNIRGAEQNSEIIIISGLWEEYLIFGLRRYVQITNSY